MKTKKFFLHFLTRLAAFGTLLICLALAVSACTGTPAGQPAQPNDPQQTAVLPTGAPQPDGGAANLPNPASVYCEQNGGRLEIRSDANGGQFGVCVFPGGFECDEWAFFRKECTPWQFGPAPALALTNLYQNPAFGFSLGYPENWSIQEEAAEYVRLSREGYTLFIGFWKTGTERPLFRSGMPSGNFYERGAHTMLGVPLLRRFLEDEGKIKLVDYGSDMAFNGLQLVIWLDAQDEPPQTYRQRDIPLSIIQEAEAILASLAQQPSGM